MRAVSRHGPCNCPERDAHEDKGAGAIGHSRTCREIAVALHVLGTRCEQLDCREHLGAARACELARHAVGWHWPKLEVDAGPVLSQMPASGPWPGSTESPQDGTSSDKRRRDRCGRLGPKTADRALVHEKPVAAALTGRIDRGGSPDRSSSRMSGSAYPADVSRGLLQRRRHGGLRGDDPDDVLARAETRDPVETTIVGGAGAAEREYANPSGLHLTGHRAEAPAICVRLVLRLRPRPHRRWTRPSIDGPRRRPYARQPRASAPDSMIPGAIGGQRLPPAISRPLRLDEVTAGGQVAEDELARAVRERPQGQPAQTGGGHGEVLLRRRYGR